MFLPRFWASTTVREDLVEGARALMDEVADAIEMFDGRAEQREAGREVIVAYYEQHPTAYFAVGQASKYLMLRMRQKAAA